MNETGTKKLHEFPSSVCVCVCVGVCVCVCVGRCVCVCVFRFSCWIWINVLMYNISTVLILGCVRSFKILNDNFDTGIN